jgi:hypothetical protein
MPNQPLQATPNCGAPERERSARLISRVSECLLLVAAVSSLSGCVGLFDRVSYSEMAPRLAYQGFSFERPPNSNWYLLRSEESHTSVTLRRKTDSDTHTFYAIVSLAKLPRQPESREDFASIVRSETATQKAPYEISTTSYDQTLETIQGQWCVRFSSTAAVRGAPQAPRDELQMIVRGVRCVHPAFPRASLDMFYSERGRPGELDPTLAAEGEQFLRAVRIDVAPNTPAT